MATKWRSCMDSNSFKQVAKAKAKDPLHHQEQMINLHPDFRLCAVPGRLPHRSGAGAGELWLG